MPLFLYNIFIRLYPFIIRLISPFNPKAKSWLQGRKNIFKNIASALNNDKSKKIWVHCASLGEFEQGRPVIEKLKADYPSYKIVLTFFSPSGYEVQKNYKSADYIFYLPMDSRANAEKFFNLIQPSLAILVKYEYWYYYISACKKRNIPLLLVSGQFLKSYSFFKWYGSVNRQMLHLLTHLFVQTENARQLLSTINITNVSVSGDTRFDRVLEVSSHPKKFVLIDAFCKGHTVFVAGSTWTEDDELIDHFANTRPKVKFIIAPHTIDEDRLQEAEKLYKNSARFSLIRSAEYFEENKHINVLIIDSIGMLKHLYAYSTVCYVGGGFGGDGIHNILEAAVYGKPVLFGPENEKFNEAAELIEAGGAFEIADAVEFEELMNELLTDEQLLKGACKASAEYVAAHAGATQQVMQYIHANRLLTN